jgi:signal transduction histidine kinase
MRRLFEPPSFASDALTQRARTFHRVALLTMAIPSACFVVLALTQPELRPRLLVYALCIVAPGLALLALNRRGHTHLASVLLVGGLVALITAMSLRAGGIRSPGVGVYLVFVLMAGLLLGHRAGIVTAVVCAGLGLGLVVMEKVGVLPERAVHYTPFTLWTIGAIYMGVVIVLLRLATGVVEAALKRAEDELAVRRAAEQERERLLRDLEQRLQEQREAEARRRVLEGHLRRAQKMDALGTLAGGIAHDFNNLLMVIGINVEVVLKDLPEGSDAREPLVEVLQAYRRAGDLVRRILLFSRKEEPARSVVELQPVMQEALKLLRSSLPAMVEIDAKYEADLPPVLIDTGQIHQVVMNLGTNAAHAMGEQGGVLSVRVGRVASAAATSGPLVALGPGEYLCIRVSDTGVGISPDLLERVFEPFFTTKGVKGTGLGLAVVHGIVREHGGAVTVKSELGVGTTFELYLPVADTAAKQAPADEDAAPTGRGERIMYVDDEPAVVLAAERLLQRLGYACIGFTDSRAALRAFAADPAAFDAVITDGAMPGMTGRQLAGALRAIRPDVRVALASAYGEMIDDANDAGFALRIAKPPGVSELARALRTLLAPVA